MSLNEECPCHPNSDILNRATIFLKVKKRTLSLRDNAKYGAQDAAEYVKQSAEKTVLFQLNDSNYKYVSKSYNLN